MSSEKKRIKHLFQKFTYRAIIELLKESLPLLLCGIFIMGQSRISHVMLNIYLNKAAVGHFAIILKMSELWLFIPAGLALSMFGPLLREHKKDGHIYQVKVQKMFSLFTFISLSIALASIPFIDPVMDFLFEEKFNFSTTPIILLLFSNIFVFWGFAQEPIDLAENLLIFRVFRAGMGIVTNILLQIVLIPRFGITGAAISIFISYAVTYSLINLATSKSRKIFVWQLKSFAFWKHL